MDTNKINLINRLQSLLPSLEYSRETHIIWRDCDQKYRDENPDIGDKDFHIECIKDYDTRIVTINDTIDFLSKSD